MQANTPWEMLPSRQRTRSAPRNSTRFAAQYSARGLPCERFTAVLTDRTSCITRGRGGWLDLPRGGLAPPILCQLFLARSATGQSRCFLRVRPTSGYPLKPTVSQSRKCLQRGLGARGKPQLIEWNTDPRMAGYRGDARTGLWSRDRGVGT